MINLANKTISKKESTLLLLIDFVTAFDSISHTFIYNTLHTLGFSQDIITWIKTFLTDRESQILLVAIYQSFWSRKCHKAT